MPVSSEMQAHLEGTLTVGVFMQITAKDGDVLRVWNGTRNKIVGGNMYYAYPLAPSRLQSSNGLNSDNMEITAIYSGLFTAATLRAKKWQGARVEYQILNYKDFSMGYAERRIAFLGKSEIGRHSAKIELNSLSSRLNEEWGRTCNPECDVDELGDSRCQVDLDGNTVGGYKIRIDATVASVINRQQFSVTFDGDIKPAEPVVTLAPDEYYRRGTFRFTSGNNDGVSGLILTSEGNGLTLYLPLFYNVQAGDTLELTTGCDRTITTCKVVFDNAINHRGFHMLPGRSKLFRLPDIPEQ